MVKPIPEGFHTVTPYLVVKDAAKLLKFVPAAFGANETSSHKLPDGRVMHASVKIGDSMVMIADAPKDKPTSPCMRYLYVPDTDAVYKTALHKEEMSDEELLKRAVAHGK